MDTLRHKTISRVTLWGALCNVMLSVLKLIAGILGRSSAMIADAVHSLSDLVSDAVVLVMLKVASKEHDKSHDYGHGKFETLATAAVSVLLFAVGVKLLVGSISRITSVAGGARLEAPGQVALWAAIISILVKEGLYQWTVHTGRRVNSPAMIANAWHHRSDALSSVGSAIGIGGAILLGGKWTILDPLVGAAISIVIIVVAIKMALPAFNELTEASLPEDVEDHIIHIIQSVPGVSNAHALKTRRTGPDIIMDVHIVVDPQMSVMDAHSLTEKAEESIRNEFGQDTQLNIHVEPDIDSE